MTDLQQDSPLECRQAGISKELSSSSVRSSRSSDSGIGCDHDCALSPSDSNPQLIPILENTGGAVCDQEETEKVEEEEDIFTTSNFESHTTADSDTMAQRDIVATPSTTTSMSEDQDNTSTQSTLPAPDYSDSTSTVSTLSALPAPDYSDSTSTVSTLSALPAPDYNDSTVIPRTRSLPAADLKHISRDRKNRRQRPLSFTGIIKISNGTVIVLAQSGHQYEEKTHMTGIYSPSASPSASRMEPAELCSPTRRKRMVHRESQTDKPDEIQPTEDAIRDAIKQHSVQFSQWINWNELALYLEKYELLDDESRTNLLAPCSSVSSRRSHYFLYQVLPSKGSSAYSRFFKALDEEKHHLGHKDLVSLIRGH